jgi:MFS family permease
MFFYFQPLYLQYWGASPVEIGAILSVAGIAMAVVQIPAGQLSDRFGPQYVMKASWVQGLLSTLVMAFSNSLQGFIVGLVLYSMTMYVSGPMNAYISRARGKVPLARAMTINSAAFNSGAILGPLLGGILGSRIGLMPILRVAAVIFVISTAMIVFIRPHPVERETSHNLAPGSLLHNRRFLAFLPLIFLTVLAAYLPQPLTPNFLENQGGLSLQTIGQLTSLGSLSNVILLLLGGGLSAKVGILAGQAMLGVYALLLWQGTSPAWYWVAYGFLGGYRLLRVMIAAFARPLAPVAQIGLAFSLLETVNASAIVVAPLVAGLLYNQNPYWVYATALILIALSLLANVIVFPRLQRQPAPLPDQLSSETENQAL